MKGITTALATVLLLASLFAPYPSWAQQSELAKKLEPANAPNLTLHSVEAQVTALQNQVKSLESTVISQQPLFAHVVVDSTGAVVGQWFPALATAGDLDAASLQINGNWFTLPVVAPQGPTGPTGPVGSAAVIGLSGFYNPFPFTFYYTSPGADCSGTAYFAANPNPLPLSLSASNTTFVVGNLVYYPDLKSVHTVTPTASQFFNPDGSSNGGCKPTSNLPQSLAPVINTPLPSFVPPFSIK